ncbi:cation diffusion facilitator family transporter [Pararhodobacter sp.]|uniref:cation diffusion facilitator family transporter n=1 Tax=Pararhodobacter sp. TaxID=2127056 RepID=UPI002FDE3367
MPHDHHGHTHLSAESGDRRVAIAIWANGLLTVAQVAGGFFAGSLALIADALHNLSDMMALVIAFAARKIARRPADGQMTFGYKRIEIVAALINYTTLIVVGLYLIYEGGMRLIDPPEVMGWIVVIIAGVALVIDTLTALLTWSMQKGSQNIRALFVHNLTDALASVAVIIGGTLIILYNLYWIDAAITIGIAAYILYLALTEISRPVRLLMLASPPGLDGAAVVAAIRQVAGVDDLHHVHLWEMQENEPALEAHIVIAPGSHAGAEGVKAAIRARLLQEFGITHTTLEFELPGTCPQTVTLFGHGSHG